MHTLFSDGKLSVPQLLQYCRSKNVKYMGITDHDTVKAVIDWKNNYRADREENDVVVIPGIELSAYSEQQPQVHITGYFPKTANFDEIELQLEKHVKEIR